MKQKPNSNGMPKTKRCEINRKAGKAQKEKKEGHAKCIRLPLIVGFGKGGGGGSYTPTSVDSLVLVTRTDWFPAPHPLVKPNSGTPTRIYTNTSTFARVLNGAM